MLYQKLTLTLLGFMLLFSSCQQRYWHVKKVRVHPEYQVQEENREKLSTAVLSPNPDTLAIRIAFHEPHFPAEAIPLKSDPVVEAKSNEPEFLVEPEQVSIPNQSTNERLIEEDEEDDDNQIRALEYVVLFAFFYTSMLLALFALYLPAAIVVLLLLGLSTALLEAISLVIVAIFLAAFLFLSYQFFRYFIRVAFPKKLESSKLDRIFILFLAFLILAIGYVALYLIDSIIVSFILGFLSLVLPLITLIYFIIAWLK